MLQNAACLRKSAAWPPNISDEHVSCTAPATRNPSLQILFKCPTSAIVFGNATKTLTFFSLLTRCKNPLPLPHKTTLQRPKVARTCGVLYIFDIEMYFAPKRSALFEHRNFQKCSEANVLCTLWLRNVLRATTACLFEHRNFQKCSEHGVLCTLWLRNVLRATTSCTFWTSQLPKVLRTRRALYMLISICASCHNIMHVFHITTAKSAPDVVPLAFSLPSLAPQRSTLYSVTNGNGFGH